MATRKDIRARDPYIIFYKGIYYMYIVRDERILQYYYSKDLENWSFGDVIFEIPQVSWAQKDLWAGEVHRYDGRFYLFITLLGKNNIRGTQVAIADTPIGPFHPITDRAATPLEQSCIDGTLYVDNDIPYIIYSRDWPSNYDESKKAYVGEIWAQQLNIELRRPVGESFKLFSSDEAPLSKATPDRTIPNTVRYGSDAPFVQKLSNGKILLTWSPYLNGNYVVLGAVSENGIKGPWKHLEKPIFDKNGGHAMFFRDERNDLCMCLHAPENMAEMLERTHIYKMKEVGDSLEIEHEI